MADKTRKTGVRPCRSWKTGCSRPSCKFGHPKGEGFFVRLKHCWYESNGKCTRANCRFPHNFPLLGVVKNLQIQVNELHVKLMKITTSKFNKGRLDHEQLGGARQKKGKEERQALEKEHRGTEVQEQVRARNETEEEDDRVKREKEREKKERTAREEKKRVEDKKRKVAEEDRRTRERAKEEREKREKRKREEDEKGERDNEENDREEREKEPAKSEEAEREEKRRAREREDIDGREGGHERMKEEKQRDKEKEKEKTQEEEERKRRKLSKELERWMQLRVQDDDERLSTFFGEGPVPMHLRRCRLCFQETEDLPHVMLRCMAYKAERADFFRAINTSRSSEQVSSAILELRCRDGCDQLCQTQDHYTQECTGPCSAVMDWLLNENKEELVREFSETLRKKRSWF